MSGSYSSSVNLCKMDLFNNLPQGRSDHLQREIADQIAGEKQPVDELQLAALLGKTLLEKNGDLELKLLKLQEFAEETLATNQTLLRQLAESKDSLQFSNHLCEQLELKVEELEASNEQLTRFCRERQALLDQKSSSLARIEDDLVTARDECDHVRADLEHLRGSGTEEGKGGSGRGNEREGGGDCDGQQMEEEVSRLREEVDTLTLRVQSAEFQKRRFKREMTNALRENANLSRNLEKAEAELAELHLGVEEICDENPVTPHDPACHMTQLVAPPDPSLPTPTTQNGSTTSPDDSQLSRSEDHHRSGDSNSQSLFSELDTQFSSLQTSYGDLLNRCTCLASLELKKQQGVDVGGEGVGPSSTDRDEGRRVGGAFKELFDEMFATLRQTAEVADRLIEKRVTSSP